MRRLFIFSLNSSETSLSPWDLLGLEVFTAFSGCLDTGKPRRTRITSPEAPQADTSAARVGGHLCVVWDYTWPMGRSQPDLHLNLVSTLPAQETLNELPTYLGFSDRDSIGPQGTSHFWTRTLSGKWHLGDSGWGTPMPYLGSLQSHREKRPQSFERP